MAADVAAAYLLVRLEVAGRHTGLPLVDPNRPPDPPQAWHLRADPGAGLFQWLIQGTGLARARADQHFVWDAFGEAPTDSGPSWRWTR